MNIIYRHATFDDVESMHKILNDYAKAGLMLPRARNAIYESLREYVVAELDGTIVGIGALHFVWDRLAEVRSLAVIPNHKATGIGRKIVELLEEEGIARGVNMFFTLTYQPIFFGKCGYEVAPKESLSPKVWKECVHCPQYPNCDEIALTKVVQKQ